MQFELGAVIDNGDGAAAEGVVVFDFEDAGGDVGVALVGVRTGEDERAGPFLGEAVGRADSAAVDDAGGGAGRVDGQGAAGHADGGIGVEGDRAGVGMVIGDVDQSAGKVAVVGGLNAVAIEGDRLEVEAGLELEGGAGTDPGAAGLGPKARAGPRRDADGEQRLNRAGERAAQDNGEHGVGRVRRHADHGASRGQKAGGQRRSDAGGIGRPAAGISDRRRGRARAVIRKSELRDVGHHILKEKDLGSRRAGGAQGAGVLHDQIAGRDQGDAGIGVGAGEGQIAAADLGDRVAERGHGVADGAGDGEGSAGETVLKRLRSVGANGGGAHERHWPGPGVVAAQRRKAPASAWVSSR